jgi:hypothetical protein
VQFSCSSAEQSNVTDHLTNATNALFPLLLNDLRLQAGDPGHDLVALWLGHLVYKESSVPGIDRFSLSIVSPSEFFFDNQSAFVKLNGTRSFLH